MEYFKRIHEMHEMRIYQKIKKIKGIKRDLNTYGVATTSRLLKIIGLFCKRAL